MMGSLKALMAISFINFAHSTELGDFMRKTDFMMVATPIHLQALSKWIWLIIVN